MNRKIKAYIISIIFGQIFALLIWLVFEKNYFSGILLGSILAIAVGYNESKK